MIEGLQESIDKISNQNCINEVLMALIAIVGGGDAQEYLENRLKLLEDGMK